ncbi:MAG: amidohydrolase family protein [Bacteroidales bacterium]|nr:amidohydrolase family protein [Bacteroidales bacterium]
MPHTLSAHYVFTNTGAPIKNGAVTINDEDGTILSVGTLDAETPNTIFYNGIIVPGLVNAHCHLELSHLRGRVTDAESLVDFVCKMSRLGAVPYQESAAEDADQDMYRQGVVAVGDICNTANTANVKQKSKIHYTNFVELLGTTPQRCKADIEQFNNVFNKYVQCGINPKSISAVAHAPYSVCPELFGVINEINKDNRRVFSIHNQETKAENTLYINHSGEIVECFPMDLSSIPVTGKTSLQSVGEYFSYDNVLLVHNIYSSAEDLDYAKGAIKNPYFVICPKSNLFLEKKIGDVPMMMRKGLTVCLGTDSLSSNDRLSMVEEMYALQNYYPEISLEDIIKFATINGAKALGMDELGVIAPCKRAGLVLINNIDFDTMRITPNSTSKRLV